MGHNFGAWLIEGVFKVTHQSQNLGIDRLIEQGLTSH